MKEVGLVPLATNPIVPTRTSCLVGGDRVKQNSDHLVEFGLGSCLGELRKFAGGVLVLPWRLGCPMFPNS